MRKTRGQQRKQKIQRLVCIGSTQWFWIQEHRFPHDKSVTRLGDERRWEAREWAGAYE